MAATPKIPTTMRALVAPKYCKPDQYVIIDRPVPKIERPHDILVRSHAASIITGETQLAAGTFRFAFSPDGPITLGMEGSGVVVAVGSAVKSVKVGDEVIGGRYQRPAFPTPYDGWAAEYAVTPEHLVLPKPPHLTFEETGGLYASVVTAYQSIRRGLELMGEESLEGKTVFIPAALSATGSVACQVAKNVFDASKVISTVSTPKLPLVEQHLPGIVDQVIDYKKQDIVAEVGRGTVDFAYNTQWGTLTEIFTLLKPQTGVVISIASIPPPSLLKVVMGENVPFYIRWGATMAQWWYDWKLRGTNVKRDFISGDPENREDWERSSEIVAMGKVKAVMTVARFDDLEAVRRAAMMVYTGKGGLGKMTVKVR